MTMNKHIGNKHIRHEIHIYRLHHKMTIQTEAIMKKGVRQHIQLYMYLRVLHFAIECHIGLTYEIFAFTARYQILMGPSQLTLPIRNVRYLEKGQARGMLTIIGDFILYTKTMIGITRLQKKVLKLHMSPNVDRTDHRPLEQGRGSKSAYTQADHPPPPFLHQVVVDMFYIQ